jgi:hypothetical protein
MAQKAHKRKRDDGKETIFLWKGNQFDRADAEKRAARSRKNGTVAAATGKSIITTSQNLH